MRSSVLVGFLLLVLSSFSFASVDVTNVAIDASQGFEISGDVVAFRTSEMSQGGIDFNSDGDANDFVLHLHNISSGVTTNLGLDASGGLRVDGDLLVFAVSEAKQGGTDLNGDLDTDDFVVHVHNVTTSTTINLGLSATGFGLDGTLVAVTVLEGGQNADLNGDGDASDGVLHVFDAATGTITNTGIDAAGGSVVNGQRVAFAAVEMNQSVDLNEDGDTNDVVLHLYDHATGLSVNLKTGVLGFDLQGDVLAYAAREDSQGEHLNGDTDMLDSVMHCYLANTGTVVNLGLAVKEFQVDANRIAFTVPEQKQGNMDVNGDGDASDDVLHFLDVATMTTSNLSMAVEGFQLDGKMLAYVVLEFRQGLTDLNGDGDIGDKVLHLLDADAGTTTNLALDASLGFKLEDGMLLAFGVSEASQGGTDGNGDGDSSDSVLHLFDVSTGTIINLAVDPSGGFQTFQLDGKRLVFGVKEAAQGATDLNGDGDSGDIVLHVYDASDDTTTNLELDVTRGHQLAGDKMAFAVSETLQGGLDLNGDGDALDVILHVGNMGAVTPTLSPRDMILALIDHVRSVRMKWRVKRCKLFMLQMALWKYDRSKPRHAVGWLRLFAYSVQRNARRHIPKADARQLIDEAKAIIDAIRAENN